MSTMDDPEHPHALILYRNALATLVQARVERDRRRAERERPDPAPVPAREVESPYLTAREAASYLRVSYSTFRKYAVRVRRCPQTGRYTRADLDEFAASLRPRRKR